jgi:hypothetical protein
MIDNKYIVIPIMTGTYKDATVTILNSTFQVKNESAKSYPAPDFGSWLVEQIYDVNKFLADARGFYVFFKKKFYCPSCSTQLDPGLRKPVETVYELKFRGFDPFTIKIVFPSVGCPKCGKVCGIDMNGSPGYDVSAAILQAFETEHIKP